MSVLRILLILLCGWGASLPAAAQRDRLTFYFDWFPGAQFAGIYVAADESYYQAAGLEVTFVPFAFGMNHPALIEATTDHCAVGAMEGYIFLQQRGKGIDLVALAAQLQESPAGYMSLASTPVRSAADFRGKRIGVHAYADPLYRLFLTRAGLKETDATMIFVKDDVESLLRGEVQAAQGYTIEEYQRLKERVGSEARFVSFKELGFDAYSEVLFTTRLQQQRSPEVLRRYVAATRQGWVEAFRAPDIATEAVRRRIPAEKAMTSAAIRSSLRALEPYVMPGGAAPLPPMNSHKWDEMQEACRDMGFITQPISSRNWIFRDN